MGNENLRKLGLVAVVLFAPGGFVLGAGLALNHLRRRAAARRSAATARAAAIR